jgi:hypothetical protein
LLYFSTHFADNATLPFVPCNRPSKNVTLNLVDDSLFSERILVS